VLVTTRDGVAVVQPLEGHASRATLSADGRALAVATTDGTITIYRPAP
jgi:hypothetical protein